MKVKRFYYVFAPTSKVRHLFFGTKFVEGEQAACGTRVQPGWGYALARLAPRRRTCARCIK